MKNIRDFNEVLFRNRYTPQQMENDEALKDFICGLLNFESKDYFQAIKNFETSLAKNIDDIELEEEAIFFYLKAIAEFAQVFFERKEYSKVTLLCDLAISQNFEHSEVLAEIYALRASANYCNYLITDSLSGINDFTIAIKILGNSNRIYQLYEFRGDFKFRFNDLLGAYDDYKKSLEFFKDKNDLVKKFNDVKNMIDKKNK